MSINLLTFPIIGQPPYYTSQTFTYGFNAATYNVTYSNVAISFAAGTQAGSQWPFMSLQSNQQQFAALVPGIYMISCNTTWGFASSATNGSAGYFGYGWNLANSGNNVYKTGLIQTLPNRSSATPQNTPFFVKMNAGDLISFYLFNYSNTSPIVATMNQMEFTCISASL